MTAPSQTIGKLTTRTVGDREIQSERVFDAPLDRVWRAFSEPELLARWWGRGNKLIVERMEFERGGHWRYIEHAPDGVHGFEGRYREIVPMQRIERTFDWDGMPGHVVVETVTFEDLGDGRTKIVTTALFHTQQERDGMVDAGAAQGEAESYDALDRLLASMA